MEKADATTILTRLYKSRFATPHDVPVEIAQITSGSGSARSYWRLKSPSLPPTIGTFGPNDDENRAFLFLDRHLRGKGLPVPEIYGLEGKCYLQEDVGSRSLYDVLQGKSQRERMALLSQAVNMLARFHAREVAEGLDFRRCYPGAEFGPQLVQWDLSYFKYCFLKGVVENVDEQALQDDFNTLQKMVVSLDTIFPWGLMLRDFQSRNIMLDQEGKMSLIDFQGAMRGPAAYDLASLLWQARLGLCADQRRVLARQYLECRGERDFEAFWLELQPVVLVRTLQVLGAYGFRGLYQGKEAFKNSIPRALHNLRELLADTPLGGQLPYLAQLARTIPWPEDTFEGKRRLAVEVISFSYKKGVPADASGNGGGYVFDCRASHNPGRYEPFKHLTGLDGPVRRFLEEDGEIQPFVKAVETLVDAHVERYLQRGFTHMQVSFGCTGGQHRSVYSADAVARHLNAKYGIKVKILHREQNISEVLEPVRKKIVFNSFLRNPQKSYPCKE